MASRERLYNLEAISPALGYDQTLGVSVLWRLAPSCVVKRYPTLPCKDLPYSARSKIFFTQVTAVREYLYPAKL